MDRLSSPATCHLLALISIFRQHQGRSLGGFVLIVVWSAIGIAIAILFVAAAIDEFERKRDKPDPTSPTGAIIRSPDPPPDGPASWQAPVEFVTA